MGSVDPYGLEEMTFAEEDEVIPTINVLDTSVDKEDVSKDDVASKKEEDGSDQTAEINNNGKRKLPEEETEKKVFVIVFCLLLCFVYHRISFLRSCMVLPIS